MYMYAKDAMWFAQRGGDSNLARYEYYCSWKNCLQSAYASIHSETHTWGKLECRLNNLVCACADIETCARSHPAISRLTQQGTQCVCAACSICMHMLFRRTQQQRLELYTR